MLFHRAVIFSHEKQYATFPGAIRPLTATVTADALIDSRSRNWDDQDE
jgi:hypothetical protein